MTNPEPNPLYDLFPQWADFTWWERVIVATIDSLFVVGVLGGFLLFLGILGNALSLD